MKMNMKNVLRLLLVLMSVSLIAGIATAQDDGDASVNDKDTICQSAVQPPSTLQLAPFTFCASSRHRNTAIAPISAG